MVVFGGRGVNSTANSTTENRGSVVLGDQWEIDLDPSRTVIVQTNASTVRHFFLLLMGSAVPCRNYII